MALDVRRVEGLPGVSDQDVGRFIATLIKLGKDESAGLFALSDAALLLALQLMVGDEQGFADMRKQAMAGHQRLVQHYGAVGIEQLSKHNPMAGEICKVVDAAERAVDVAASPGSGSSYIIATVAGFLHTKLCSGGGCVIYMTGQDFRAAPFFSLLSAMCLALVGRPELQRDLLDSSVRACQKLEALLWWLELHRSHFSKVIIIVDDYEKLEGCQGLVGNLKLAAGIGCVLVKSYLTSSVFHNERLTTMHPPGDYIRLESSITVQSLMEYLPT